jgi:hypothetical protein
MQETNDSTTQPQLLPSLAKRMLVGWGIGLLVISVFVVPTVPDPAWGKFWMIRPLIITPLAGAMGGLCNYYIIRFHERVGVNKILAIIVSALVFIVGLWMGIILGLDGTLWD